MLLKAGKMSHCCMPAASLSQADLLTLESALFSGSRTLAALGRGRN